MTRFLLILCLVVSISFGCKKEPSDTDCKKLTDSMAADDIPAAKSIITQFINRLSSDKYTSQNLNTLVKSLSQRCGISATVLCFDCIETLPGQSEISISFTSVNGVLRKTIDISYSPDNKMKFVYMHD